jgi:hypothetical protein
MTANPFPRENCALFCARENRFRVSPSDRDQFVHHVMIMAFGRSLRASVEIFDGRYHLKLPDEVLLKQKAARIGNR